MIEGITIPSSWSWCRLSELVEYVTSGSRDWSKFYADTGALFVRTQDINTNRLDLSAVARVALPPATEGKRTLLKENDILITITGANVGKCAIVAAGIPEGYVSQSVALVRLGEPQFAKYVHLSAQTAFRGRQTELQRMAYGIGRPVLNLDNVRNLPIPVAPIDEQHRIVEAIESYFTRIDEAVATLERVQRNLKRYRASVLQAAVEGRLVPTEAELARAAGRDYEPASVLLARILAERRRRWEESEVAKMKAKGKAPKDDKWKAKYKAPTAPKTDELPELPEGWCWSSVQQILEGLQTGPFGSSLHKSDYSIGGTPVINPQHLRHYGIFPSDDVAISPETVTRLSGFLLKVGDVVLGRRGEMGRCAVVRPREAGWLLGTGSLAITPVLSVDPHYFAWVLRSPRSVRTLEGESVGTTMTNLNQEILLRLPFPLPSSAEQLRIVQEIDRHYSVIEDLERDVKAQQIRLVRLRQSILKWAFEGRLVDEDPTDEPASALLERIKAERSAPAPMKKAKNPRRATKA